MCCSGVYNHFIGDKRLYPVERITDFIDLKMPIVNRSVKCAYLHGTLNPDFVDIYEVINIPNCFI